LIKHTGINTLIKTKILESYVIHADPESVPRYVSTNILIDCGRIERLVRQGISDPDPDNFIFAAEIFETLPDLNFSKTYLYLAVMISFLKAWSPQSDSLLCPFNIRIIYNKTKQLKR
jgi:hypothetical protein